MSALIDKDIDAWNTVMCTLKTQDIWYCVS